ncbi:E3 ubiquitin-protein ligase TRIM56-like isoform X1 [Saccoglossus kowalevskii]|uniref:E3 ubiquitin-protein ligase TRIM56-like n=1 Tax=Saccoglossus kowalevskii TaxID=10224 RepID=A0ABM0GLA3_SACKO|nr:PREDICTED: E3 ubiquitin-protein ligase TRIM56-like [Saccoglossus kowalevskii]
MATSNEDRAAVLDKIDEDFLTCSICQERITNPKILDCLHSFCARCLKDYAAKNPIFKANPSCPVCRMSFRLPESGVDGLKNNFFVSEICKVFESYRKTRGESKVNCFSCESEGTSLTLSYCLQCSEFLCRECSNHHTKMKSTKEHQVLSGDDLLSKRNWVESRSKSTSLCRKHKTELLKLFCSTCKVPVCILCSLQEHTGHKNIDIDNAAKTTKDAILSQISVAEERISQCQYSLNRAEQTGQELESCRVKAKKDIDERAKNLIHLLTEQIELHAENLKREVDERAAVKRIVIDKYKKEMEEQIDRASSTCDYSGKVLSYGNNTEVLLMEKQVCGKLNSVTKESISKLPTTGKMKLENYNMVPVIKYADIGRVVWTMSGPLLAAEMTEGDRVERGSDWIWQNQDGGAGCKGTVLSKPNKGHWVKVKWDKGGENIYRMGASGHYDLERADDRDKRLNLDQVSKTSSSWLNWIGL